MADRAHDVATQVREGVGALTRRLRQVHVTGALSWREASALARLARGGPLSGAALAQQERVSPQSMGATVKALERRRLVTRSADPGDGRRVLFAPTPAGTRLHEEGGAARVERLAAALDGFTDAELDRLAAAAPLLLRLADRL